MVLVDRAVVGGNNGFALGAGDGLRLAGFALINEASALAREVFDGTLACAEEELRMRILVYPDTRGEISTTIPPPQVSMVVQHLDCENLLYRAFHKLEAI